MELDLRDRATIRQYLLGELAREEERERVEERLLAEDNYFDAFQLIKEEIIDEYVEGALTGEERERFERHFLTTAERQLSLRVARTLTVYPAPSAGKKKAKNSEPARSPFTRARALFQTPLFGAACLLALTALAAGVWLAFFRQPSTVNGGLAALADAYRVERPVEARVSGFRHVPLANNRSGDEIRFDRSARERAEVLLHSAARGDRGPAARSALGKLYLFKGQFELAILELEEALKSDGNNPRILSDLGAAWLEQGAAQFRRGEEAESYESLGKSLAHLNRAFELDPALPEALFNRALVHQHLKLFRLAADDWNKYLELDAASPWADEARQQLKSIEGQKGAVTQDGEEVFRRFLAARDAADDETAWRLLSRSRDFTGSFIENRLLNEHLDAAAGGRDGEARERLRALSYCGDLNVRRAGDHFISDLVSFYSSATGARRAALAQARALMKSGNERLQQDSTAEALELYDAAARLFEQQGDAGERLLVRYTVGHSRLLQGESALGRTEFETLSRESEAKHYRWLHAQSLTALANVHIGFNEYSTALGQSRRSLEIFERVGDVVGVVKVNDQLGVEHLRVGNPREALGFNRRAVTLGSESALGPLSLWRSYFTAAMSFHALGLSDAAIDFTREALRLAEDTKSPVNVSRTYAHLGLMYGGRGKYEEAISYIRSASDSGRSIRTEKVRTNALAYAALQFGHLYHLAGDFDRAVESYDEALRLYEQLGSHAFSYVAHKGKFLSCVARPGRCPSVDEELEAAMRLYEEHRSKIVETMNRYSFFDSEQGVYDVAIDYEFTTRGDAQKAFLYSERCRARSLLGPAAEHDARGAHTPPPSPAAPESLDELRARMPEDAQIIQYAVLNDKLLIWFVSRTGFEWFESNVSARELEEKVLDYLRLVLNRAGGDEEERRRAAAALYALLVEPVGHLLDREKLVCIVPDKILNRLPYAALVSAEGRYLIEDYALTFSPSSTMFVVRSDDARARFGPGAETVLSVGDPRFDARAYAAYKNLPAADAEAKEVAALYDSSEQLIGSDATKERVLRAMTRADVIHLATHSVVDEHSPMSSKLLLAKESDAVGGDGALLTSEIYRLNLARPRLVVLSACRTAAEKYYGGEGMVGVWSPFVTRSVPLVVASLWPVDSDSTKELMINFHRLRRRGGLPSASALRQAQVEMLRGPDRRYRQPYHWAAFIAIGGLTKF